MKLKTLLSFLLLLFVGHGCKQVYDVDISQPNVDTVPYHVFFVDRDLNDNLGVIVTDTNKREINFFYGDKNSKGNLVNIQQIVTYLPQNNLLINFDLDENLFPRQIIYIRNDTIITAQFKNYDLKTNTVDVELFDTKNILINRREKVSCGEALLKIKEAKGQFDIEKGLRLATGVVAIDDECNKILKAVSNVANGIGCIMGFVGILPTAISTLTGVGVGLFIADIGFTIFTCASFTKGITAQFRGECLELADKQDYAMTASECAVFVFKIVRERRFDKIGLLKDCITNVLSDLSEWRDEYLNPRLPNIPIPTETVVRGTSSGDPNIITFDGKSYSFNGVGEFIAVKSTTDNFEIQVRQEELKSRNASGSVSWSTGLAINTGNDKLCFYPTKYFINGTQYAYNSSISHSLQNGASVAGGNSSLIVSANNGDMIKIFNRGDALDYSVMPGAQRQGKMIGIFGDYNKSESNDLQIRNGATIDGSYSSLYPTFTNSWRIDQAQSLFIYDSGKNTTNYTDRSFPRAPLVITASQRANAEQTCKNAGVHAPFLEGCINDVVATNDPAIAQRAKDVQEASIVKSFDIKFGPNDDKSLLKNTFNSSQYGLDYLLCDLNTYPEIPTSVSIINGFETVIYMASETPDLRQSTLSSFLLLELFTARDIEWDIQGGSRYGFYDPLLNLDIGIDPKIYIFDGKLHKVIIQSKIDWSTNTSTYRLFFDDVLMLEDENFNIRGLFGPNALLSNTGLSLSFNKYSTGGMSKVKLYRWSFKSY